MIELLKNKLSGYRSNEEKYNFLREYLQLLILKAVEELGYFRNLAFVGGTALRILYDLKRFSEDLDFCLVNHMQYDFNQLMIKLKKRLSLENIAVSIKYKDKKTVASAFIKFDNLLHQLDLSTHVAQKLMVKFEVDQNPPKGYKTVLTVINKEYLIGINHYDLPSLFAGKLHAVLYRKYAKGRDFYDLVWYLGKKIQPNYHLLNQAILQTEYSDPQLDSEKLIKVLKEKILSLDLKKLKHDVRPFLENPAETKYFDAPILVSLIERLA